MKTIINEIAELVENDDKKMIYTLKIKCDCGSNEYKKEPVLLISNPPQYVFSCVECGKPINIYKDDLQSLIFDREADLAAQYLSPQPFEMRGWSIIKGGMYYGPLNMLNQYKDPHWYYMRSCGRKDKIGRTMFVGDIVEFQDGEGQYTYGVITFQDSSFLIDSGFIKYYRWTAYDDFYILGNIFENYELLKKYNII